MAQAMKAIRAESVMKLSGSTDRLFEMSKFLIEPNIQLSSVPFVRKTSHVSANLTIVAWTLLKSKAQHYGRNRVASRIHASGSLDDSIKRVSVRAGCQYLK